MPEKSHKEELTMFEDREKYGDLSPAKLVKTALQDIVNSHSSCLAGFSSITVTNLAVDAPPKLTEQDDNLLKVNLASRRPHCPPFDGMVCAGTSLSADDCIISETVLNPPERVAPHQIVDVAAAPSTSAGGDGHDDNSQHFHAVINAIATITTLCDEVHELDRIAESKIFPALVMFGPHPKLFGSASSSSSSSSSPSFALPTSLTSVDKQADQLDERAMQMRELDLIERMGNFFPFLQTVQNFAMRCQRLVHNLVGQIAGCSQNSSKSMSVESMSLDGTPAGEHTKAGVFGKNVHVVPLAECIGTLLRLLITIDAAVASNEELLKAWKFFNEVAHDKLVIVHENNQTDTKLEAFEVMLLQLDLNLMSSRSFIMCIEQTFTDHPVAGDDADRSVEGTTDFVDCEDVHKEIKRLVAIMYKKICAGLNTDHETFERRDAIGMYGMYALYRRILPSHLVPDSKLHRALWSSFPGICPVLPLFGSLPFVPTEFVLRYASFENIGHDPASVRAEAASLIKRSIASFPHEVSRIRSETRCWLAVADSQLSETTGDTGIIPESQDDALPLPISSPLSIENIAALITRGLLLAHRASSMMKNLLIMHQSGKSPFSTASALALVHLAETVKSIEKMLRVRRRSAVTSNQRAILKGIASKMYRRFGLLRSALDQHVSSLEISHGTHFSRDAATLSACLCTIEGLLKGSTEFSQARRAAIGTSSCISSQIRIPSGMTSEDITALDARMKELWLISDVEDNLKSACDCSFLFFYADILPFMMRTKNAGATNAICSTRVALLLDAITDPSRELLPSALHLDQQNYGGDRENALVEEYRTYLLDKVLFPHLIQPLYLEVETDLRLTIHSRNYAELEGHEMLTTNGDSSLIAYLQLPPVIVCGRPFCIKSTVEERLGKEFCEMVCMANSDAETYSQMRALAKSRYQLNIRDYDQPLGSLDCHGVDIINVLQHFDGILTKWSYDNQNQELVEQQSNDGWNSGNTITVTNMAASMRKHGLGTVHRGMKCVEEFLTKAFADFCSHLMDDAWQSILWKQKRSLDPRRGTDSYSFDQAEEVRGELEEAEMDERSSRISKLIAIIRCMGNALGFARILRSAGRKRISDEHRFIMSGNPLKQERSSIEDGGQQTELQQQRSDFDQLENVLFSKKKSAIEFSNNLGQYSKKLRATIKQDSNDKNGMNASHLKVFYLGIPALTLTWMESILKAREDVKMTQTSPTMSPTPGSDVYLVDDGFAVGVTFLLNLLHQTAAFDSLLWFPSLFGKLDAEKQTLVTLEQEEAQRRAAAAGQRKRYFTLSPSSPLPVAEPLSSAESMQQQESASDAVVVPPERASLTTSTVTQKRLNAQRREMEMLFFDLHGARSLFQ